MTLRFTTLPPSTNHLYGAGRNGSRFLKPEVKAAKESIGWEARTQFRGAPLTGPLVVEIELRWPDKRKHDVDNIKALLDALNGIVWTDDGQISDLHIVRQLGSPTPGVEMRVSEQKKSPRLRFPI